MRRLFPFGLLLVALPLSAALDPKYELRDRQRATHHLQFTVEAVQVGEGRCRVQGRLAQVFFSGDNGPEQAGDALVFELPCLTPGFEPMPGPTLWFSVPALQAANVMEGFFVRGPDGRLWPNGGQVSTVPALRDRPWCSPWEHACDLP